MDPRTGILKYEILTGKPRREDRGRAAQELGPMWQSFQEISNTWANVLLKSCRGSEKSLVHLCIKLQMYENRGTAE